MIYAIFFPTADLDLLRRALTVAEGLAESLEIAAHYRRLRQEIDDAKAREDVA